MTVRYPRFKAAACHAASVFLDAAASIDKACALVDEAARNGASLIAFPESFVPGFPIWAALRAPIYNHDLFARFAAEALTFDDPAFLPLRQTIRQHGVVVSIGFTERSPASVGCLWNANLLIGAGGQTLNHHRKLVPTFYEKLIWANGDARGLRVNDTPVGKIGMLICGENTNPLARYALMAQGEQVHISSYPPSWPTRPPGQTGAYDLRRAIEIRAGGHAFEAKVFNIVASGVVDATVIDALQDRDAAAILDGAPKPVSMILDPSGTPISDVLCESEGLVYAEIDCALGVEPKQFHDVVGGYNRFDIFHLTVHRDRQDPAWFDETGRPGETTLPPGPTELSAPGLRSSLQRNDAFTGVRS